MKIKFDVKDILTVPQGYTLVTTIPETFGMYGVAKQIDEAFNARERLINKYPSFNVTDYNTHCVSISNVYFLINKHRAKKNINWDWFGKAFEELRNIVIQQNIKKIAMPKIGAGHEHVDWEYIEELIINNFSDTDVEFLVCVMDSSLLEDDFDSEDNFNSNDVSAIYEDIDKSANDEFANAVTNFLKNN